MHGMSQGHSESPRIRTWTEMQLSEGWNCTAVKPPQDVKLDWATVTAVWPPKVARLKLKGEATVTAVRPPCPEVARLKLKGEAAVTAIRPPHQTAVSGDPPTLHDCNFPILNVYRYDVSYLIWDIWSKIVLVKNGCWIMSLNGWIVPHNQQGCCHFWLIGLKSQWAYLIINHKLCTICLWTHSDGAHGGRYTLPLPTPTHKCTLKPKFFFTSHQHQLRFLSNLHNTVSFHEMIKIRGNNPILTLKPNIFLHISSTSTPISFKPS